MKTENHKREHYQGQNNCNILGVPISADELKIRSELGMKIERGLEEEIKEGIYHLALRLHRIYQERKERSAKESVWELDNTPAAKAHSEVNISIRMEGRTKVEIKEINKEVAEKGYPYNPRNSRPQHVKEEKKGDWVKTLRTGFSPVCASRSSCVSSKYKDKKLSTGPNVFNKRKINGMRGKNASSSGLVKQNACVDKKILRLGWKV